MSLEDPWWPPKPDAGRHRSRDPRALARDEGESGDCLSRLSHATHAHFRHSSTIFAYFTFAFRGQAGRHLSVKQAQLKPWGLGG